MDARPSNTVVTATFTDGSQMNLDAILDPTTGQYQVVCDLCAASITLTKNASETPFVQHRNSKKCRDAVKALQRRQELDAARAARQSMCPTPISSKSSTPMPTSLSSTSLPVHPTSYNVDPEPLQDPARTRTPHIPSTPLSTSSPTSTPPSQHQQLLHAQTRYLEFLPTDDIEELARRSDDFSERSESPSPNVSGHFGECKGSLVEWTPGSVWSTYPYHQHDARDWSWEPIGFENKSWIRLRSTRCAVFATRNDLSCDACRVISSSPRFQTFLTRAARARPNMAWEYLTQVQLHAHTVDLSSRLRKLTLKLSGIQHQNMNRKMSTMRRRINDHQRITILLSRNDIAGLRRLLTVVLRRGTSLQKVLNQLERAIAGIYSPRGHFSNRDLDVAFLAKALGGPRLLYALHKSHRFASLSTVQQNVKIPHLLSSVSIPSRKEINANITAFLHPDVKPPPPSPSSGILPGLEVMIDGVALEERCHFLAPQNCIVGICREHSHNVDPHVTSIEAVRAVEKALHGDASGKTSCCYGKDGTVVAIAPYARDDHYTPVPIVMSPSCKTEKGPELAAWLSTVLDCWKQHQYGQALHGPIWALASDGEASFRVAKFQLCMRESVNPTFDLGHQLQGMPGLNLLTGRDGVVGTCDPKHVIKRFATLLRNPLGIMVGDVNISVDDIYRHLQDLPGMDAEKARELLNPADKQNVPKAVNLIQDLLKLDRLPLPLLPAEAKRRCAITFVARIMSFFVLPFISIDMSLSDQIQSLSTYAHLIMAMYCKHGTAFMTSVLYADSQSIIKNIIFITARLQILSPLLLFYIMMEGTDRLEAVFSNCRTQDHSRNFDALQLVEKLSIGAIVEATFERNPELDRGHRRLSLKDAMGVDHVNPKSWIGDVCVGNVELAVQFTQGSKRANDILEEFFSGERRIDFEEFFSHPEHDLLRPEGQYIGVRVTVDDARTESEVFTETTSPILSAATSISLSTPSAATFTSLPIPIAASFTPPSTPIVMHRQNSDVEGEVVNEVEDGGVDLGDDANSEAAESGDYNDDIPEGMGIEDFLPDTVEDIEEGAVSEQVDKFLIMDGKKFLKASIVMPYLTSKRARKVTMRTLRAHGVTVKDLHKPNDWNSADLTSDDLCHVGDIVGVIVHNEETVCLAIFKILSFEREGVNGSKTRHTSIDIEELERSNSHLNVNAQILEMRHVAGGATESDSWEWTGQYIRFKARSEDDRLTHRQFVVSIPGHLVHPLGPTLVPQTQDPSESASAQTTKDSPTCKLTWKLSSEQLQEVLDYAWDSLSPESEDIINNFEQVVALTATSSLPYQNADGDESLVVVDIPAHLTVKKATPNTSIPCYLCNKSLLLPQMRNHIGEHIILAHRKIPEAGLNQMPRTIWKYNTMLHLAREHASEDGTMPEIPGQLLVDMFISTAEESAMGVEKEVTQKWRGDNQIPGSDVVEQLKRDRAESSVVQERHRKSARR
ncbi:hypothetical protein EW146_g6638 [Bondarzewia mesenterica]|uniref:Uncharacterized protein n=1 Tax=Bondarzewia mesenterica TaxID=1095465 RepID=A0A4S4LQ01_9AGAM|nr:hypothetical protein EW146_g6638 [Bondarzewia mesenterica]